MSPLSGRLRALLPSLPACAAIACLFPAPLMAEPLRVLFLGNSFTQGGTASVPTIFDRLAIAGGQEDPTTIMNAVAGQDFQFHETNPGSRNLIASRPWTHVVLQNYSSQPTHIGSIADHYTYGGLLYDRVMANNASTKVVLFETWSRAVVHPQISGTSTPTTFASTAEMQGELRENYNGLANSLNSAHPLNPPVVVAPAGDAWENAGGFLPKKDPLSMDLHAADDYHGNNNGYYLTAAVIYATIYHTSPEGLSLDPAISSLNLNFTVSPTILERQAWDTVTGNTGTRFQTQPQSATVSPGQSTTFSATVRGLVPYQIQWYRNDEPIPGATKTSLTLSNITPAMDGGVYTARLSSASTASLSSDPAILTVVPDTTPPSPSVPVLSDPQTIFLSFDEAISPGPASEPGSFTVIYRGQVIPVISVVLSADGKSVTLTLASPITGGFAVGITNAIGDASGNVPAQGTIVISKSDTPAPEEIFIDFGAANLPTTIASGRTWNNIDATIGATDTGTLDPLVAQNGTPTQARLEMIRRFNGTNTNGTTTSGIFPATATQDSLYGNTETFNNLSDVVPAFRIAGLNPVGSYTLTFYASRSGSENRTAVYTVTGDNVYSTSLNASGNVSGTAVIGGIMPSPAGDLTIEISPHASNNNANHFTHLGTLVITSNTGESPALLPPVILHGQIILDWTGAGSLESSVDLAPPWTPVAPTPTPPFVEPLSGPSRFYRLAPAAP